MTEHLTASQMGLSKDFHLFGAGAPKPVATGKGTPEVHVNRPGAINSMLDLYAAKVQARTLPYTEFAMVLRMLADFYFSRTKPFLKIEPSIQLSSGVYFDFQNPRSTPASIADIAAGLSRICRFTGQVREDVDHYSVAQHSVLASILIEDQTQAYHALMHDSHESVMGDVSSPLKQLLPDFKDLERVIETAFAIHHGYPAHMTPEVKQADLRMLATEKRDLMPPDLDPTDEWKWLPEPYDLVIKPWPARIARDAFLARWAELTDKHDPTFYPQDGGLKPQVRDIEQTQGLNDALSKAIAQARHAHDQSAFTGGA